MSAPSFSVVICTFNRAALLKICLESLSQAEPPPCDWEVVVVDNNSEDETAEVVGSYQQKISDLRLKRISDRNLSVARNHGCAQARGGYLVYLDDDAKVPTDYLRNVAACLLAQTPDLMGGPVYPYYTTTRPSWFRDAYETKKFAEVSGFYRHTRLTGANFIIRKDVLAKVGYFDPARGMQGNKYVIGDERKVLDTYRHIVPEDRQKIYYALECPVFHHVDPRKLRFHYFLYRFYVSAFSNTMIRYELGLPYPSPAEFLKEILWMPRNLLTALWRERRKDDPAQRDYPLAVSRTAAKLGNLAGTLVLYMRRFRGESPQLSRRAAAGEPLTNIAKNV